VDLPDPQIDPDLLRSAPRLLQAFGGELRMMHQGLGARRRTSPSDSRIPLVNIVTRTPDCSALASMRSKCWVCAPAGRIVIEALRGRS
jgi:hypothetical protein